MSRPTRRYRRALAVVSVSVLAACSDSSRDAASGPLHADTRTSSEASDLERAQIREVELAAQVDNLVATCMRRRGFEYEPGFLAVLVRESVAHRERISDYVPRYGFGIATTIGRPTQRFPLPRDPNQTLRDQLDPAALRKWVQAASECQRYAEARLAARGQARVGLPAAPSEDVRRTALQDPSVVQAAHGWSECMASFGYFFARPEDAEQDISGRAAPFQAAYDEALLRSGDDAPIAFADVFSPDQLAELERLQKYELDLAAKYHTCDDEYEEAFRSAIEAGQRSTKATTRDVGTPG